jgi:hypothetical protein
MTFLTNTTFKKLDLNEQLKIKDKIYRTLASFVNQGVMINKAELLTGKELQISSNVVGQVSITKKFKDFYALKRNR